MQRWVKRWWVWAFLLVLLAALVGVSWTELSRRLRHEVWYDRLRSIRSDGEVEH